VRVVRRVVGRSLLVFLLAPCPFARPPHLHRRRYVDRVRGRPTRRQRRLRLAEVPQPVVDLRLHQMRLHQQCLVVQFLQLREERGDEGEGGRELGLLEEHVSELGLDALAEESAGGGAGVAPRNHGGAHVLLHGELGGGLDGDDFEDLSDNLGNLSLSNVIKEHSARGRNKRQHFIILPPLTEQPRERVARGLLHAD